MNYTKHFVLKTGVNLWNAMKHIQNDTSGPWIIMGKWKGEEKSIEVNDVGKIKKIFNLILNYFPDTDKKVTVQCTIPSHSSF
jgi:hypothetical protein